MSHRPSSKDALSRRRFLGGVTGGVLSAPLGARQVRAAGTPAVQTQAKTNPHAAEESIWRLDRPQPALPQSYFWTWDHRCNWMLDDPGTLNMGCTNRYMKRPDTYLEDYRRLTDMAAGLGVKGIVIWGFLRDAHGGIEYAKRVADHATARGVAIMPGIGTNAYGGIYYEGDHPFNIQTFVREHPEARSIDAQGVPREHGLCASHPGYVDWVSEGVKWLYREFNIGGANFENGDFNVCHCPRCRTRLNGWPEEPEFWMHQCLSYEPALNAVNDRFKHRLNTWATYTGFVPGEVANTKHRSAYLQCGRPAVLDRLPADAVCQWTLTRMVRDKPLPLTAYLDDGLPAEALVNDRWSADVRPPTGVRSVGYMHHGSMLWSPGRYDVAISSLKEGCLRAWRSGLEGVSIYGEMSSAHVPWALNYLAFSHFIHWPQDSLRRFGRETLGQVLASPEEGEAFVELLAHWDARTLSDAQKKDLGQRAESLRRDVLDGKHLTRWRFWNWLGRMAEGYREAHTVSIV